MVCIWQFSWFSLHACFFYILLLCGIPLQCAFYIQKRNKKQRQNEKGGLPILMWGVFEAVYAESITTSAEQIVNFGVSLQSKKCAVSRNIEQYSTSKDRWKCTTRVLLHINSTNCTFPPHIHQQSFLQCGCGTFVVLEFFFLEI